MEVHSYKYKKNKSGNVCIFTYQLCCAEESITLYCTFCLFVQNDKETANHVFILEFHYCSTPWDFIAHALLRTACGEDVFCENCREYAWIKSEIFVVSQIVDD